MDIQIHHGGPSEFDYVIEFMKDEMKAAIAEELIIGERPLGELVLQTQKIMDSPPHITTYAVVTLRVEFRDKKETHL